MQLTDIEGVSLLNIYFISMISEKYAWVNLFIAFSVVLHDVTCICCEVLNTLCEAAHLTMHLAQFFSICYK